MKIVIKVVLLPAMLGKASNARMTLPITADATQVAPSRVSDKDVGAQIDGLGRPHELPADARQLGQLHCAIGRDEEIDVLRDRLGRCQGTEERDALHTGANTCSPHEGQYGEKQGTARFGNCRRWCAGAIAMPSALTDMWGFAIHSPLLVEICGMPKVVEFVLHTPTDVLCPRSQFAEAFNVGASLGERQAQYAVY